MALLRGAERPKRRLRRHGDGRRWRIGLDALQPGSVGARSQRLRQIVMIGPLFPKIGSVSGSAVPAMSALVA